MTLTILVNILLPIFLLIGVGIIVDRSFKIDLPTLSKLNFYVFVPALVFVKTIDAQLSPALFGTVALFTAIHLCILFVFSWLLFRLPPFYRQRPVLTLAAVLSNAGNYGIPLATLAFGSLGASAMAIVVMVQNLLTFTGGLWIMDSGRTHWIEISRRLLKVPVVWAVVAALVLVALQQNLPKPIMDPLSYLSDGLIPVALITLGVQLSRSSLGAQLKLISLITVIRLLISPVLALVMIAVWKLLSPASIGSLAPVLVIAAGMPVAVNVYILSEEYQRDSPLASQLIFATTLLSALTLTLWLLVVH